jgi:predicted transcriptional regulator
MSWVEPDESADGLADVLETRASLLAALADGARDKRALRDELGVARSTVYKGVRQLVSLGLARKVDGEYELTAYGRIAHEHHHEYREQLARLAETRSVLAELPASVDLPSTFLADATVVTADRYAPERPLSTFEAVVEDTDRVCSLSPVALPRYMADLHEDVRAGDDRELVVERGAAAVLADAYDEFAAALADGLVVYAIDEPLELGLTVFDDDAVTLTTYDEGSVRGILLAESEAAVEWAVETYESYRDRGERL